MHDPDDDDNECEDEDFDGEDFDEENAEYNLTPDNLEEPEPWELMGEDDSDLDPFLEEDAHLVPLDTSKYDFPAPLSSSGMRSIRDVMLNKRKKAFIKYLAESGQVTIASHKAGWKTLMPAYRHRKADPRFAEAWEEVLEYIPEMLESELIHRAVNGVLEPVFYKGDRCGWIRKKSDRLLLAAMKAHKRDKYSDHVKVENDTNIRVGIALLPSAFHSSAEWEQQAKHTMDNRVPVDLLPRPSGEQVTIDITPNKVQSGRKIERS